MPTSQTASLNARVGAVVLNDRRLLDPAAVALQRTLKIVGAVGVIASLAPIDALIVGHIAVGAGAFLGVRAMLASAEGPGSASTPE